MNRHSLDPEELRVIRLSKASDSRATVTARVELAQGSSA